MSKFKLNKSKKGYNQISCEKLSKDMMKKNVHCNELLDVATQCLCDLAKKDI